MQEQVTVLESADTVVDTGERSETLTARQIANLSLAGRDVTGDAAHPARYGGV